MGKTLRTLLALVGGIIAGTALFLAMSASADDVTIKRVPGAEVTEIGEQREVTVAQMVGKVPHYSKEIRTAVSFQLDGKGKVYTDIVAGDFEVGQKTDAYEIVVNGDTFYALWNHGMVNSDELMPVLASLVLGVLIAVAIATGLGNLSRSKELEAEAAAIE